MINGAHAASSATPASGSSASPTSSSTDDRQVRAFLERLLEQVEGKRLDRITPRVEARLPDGSRLTAAIPPVSSNGHPICSIRRFRLAAGSLDDLVELGFLSEQAADFLAACVRAGKNIVVAGRVSTGKTTLLNALGRAIPAHRAGRRLRVLGRAAAPARARPTASATRPAPASTDGLPPVTLEDLVSDALRMNPDRIIVGECRGPETMAMLWSFATGHAGMTSVHGESAEHALREPRPLRPHLRRPHRGRAGTRLAPRGRPRRPLRPPPQLTSNGERSFLPRQIDEIVEVTGVEGRPTHPQPALRRRRTRSHLPAQRPRVPRRPPRAGLPTMTTATRPLLLLVAVAAISAGCGGASGNVAAQRRRQTRTDDPCAASVATLRGSGTDGDSGERSAVALRALAQPHPGVGDTFDPRPSAQGAAHAAAATRRNAGHSDQEPLGQLHDHCRSRSRLRTRRATAVVRSHQRVAPYKSGRRLGQGDLWQRPRAHRTPSTRQHAALRRLARLPGPMKQDSDRDHRRGSPARLGTAGRIARRAGTDSASAGSRSRTAASRAAAGAQIDVHSSTSGHPRAGRGQPRASAVHAAVRTPVEDDGGTTNAAVAAAALYPPLAGELAAAAQAAAVGPGRSGTRTGQATSASTCRARLCSCFTITGTGNTRPAAPPLTPATIAAHVADRLPLSSGEIKTSPPVRGLTGAASWFWLDPAPATEQLTVSLAGEAVTVTAVPEVEWQFGDGSGIDGGAGCSVPVGPGPRRTRSRTSTTRAACRATTAATRTCSRAAASNGYRLVATVSWRISYRPTGRSPLAGRCRRGRLRARSSIR